MEKAKEFQKNIYFCFIDYAKAFDCVVVVSSEVAQSCLTLCDPVDRSLPGSSVHGIFQAIVLEWVAIAFSNKAEIDVFLELFCFFHDPTDVGNLISGSSAFSKSQLEVLEVHGSRIAKAWLGEF